MDITNVIEALIALVAAVIAVFVIPWVRRRSSAADIDEMLVWIRIAVAAAEQLFKAADGKSKLGYVMGYLSDKGYDIGCADIRNAVEAAVLKLHTELYGTGGSQNEGNTTLTPGT